MEPFALVIIPGFIGGLIIALLFARLNRTSKRGVAFDAFGHEPLSADVINIARIRVAGIGGLGLVAMAVVVAIAIPRIGQSLAIGLVLGALFAVILVVWRKGAGPMPSSGRRAGANTTLSIDSPASSLEDDRADAANGRKHH
jgi:hypothetical protein